MMLRERGKRTEREKNEMGRRKKGKNEMGGNRKKRKKLGKKNRKKEDNLNLNLYLNSSKRRFFENRFLFHFRFFQFTIKGIYLRLKEYSQKMHVMRTGDWGGGVLASGMKEQNRGERERERQSDRQEKEGSVDRGKSAPGVNQDID